MGIILEMIVAYENFGAEWLIGLCNLPVK